MDRRLLVFLLFFFPVSLIAQNNLTGLVTDDDGKVIPFVQISCNEIGLKITADENGQFDFFVPLGRKVKFKKKGYKPLTLAVISYKSVQLKLEQKNQRLSKNAALEESYVFKKDSSSFSFSPIITSESFNLGNIHHPLELIQGHIAGLMITRGGGNNPLGRVGVRMRGLSTINDYQNNNLEAITPHYIVDGMPAANLDLIDPLMISSFKILKGAEASQYGMRGSRGVIEVNTTASRNSGIQYHSYVGFDRPVVNQEFMDANTFTRNGGTDFGGNTDWLDAVSRRAVSQVHQLSLTQQKEQTRFRVALNYRDANGVLLQQGFNHIQANFFLEQKALNNKLTLGLQNRITSQEDNQSQPLAFRYAQSANPTLPIFEENSNHGGYSELAIFNQYNPLALIEQNQNLGRQSQLFNRAFAKFQVLPNLQFNASYTSETVKLKQQEYSKKTSFWRGINTNGLAKQAQLNRHNQFFDTHFQFDENFKKFDVSLKLGHQYQIITNEGFGVSTGDFITDATTFNNLAISNDIPNGDAFLTSQMRNNKFSAFYSTVDLSFANALNIKGGWRMEGNSRLGPNNKWGHFPFMMAEFNTASIFKSQFFQNNPTKIRTGIGLSGNPPHANYLTVQQYSPSGNAYTNGRFEPYYGKNSLFPNPNLSWEKKSEFDLGISTQFMLNKKPLRLQLDGYRSNATDLILLVPSSEKDFRNTYDNTVELKSTGIELQLSYPIITGDLEWVSSIFVARDRTQYVKVPNAMNISGFGRRPGGPNIDGCCKIMVTQLIEGDLIGDFWVFNALGVDQFGEFILEDVNGDGSTGLLDDLVASGNGLPDFSLSWNNRISIKNFSLNFRFWGAMGHQVFNATKKWGSFLQLTSSYNVLAEAASNEFDKEFPIELNTFIEDASFIRLSNYEMRTEYLPTRSFVFGVQIGI